MSIEYTYDPAGNRLTQDDGSTRTTYTYDNIGQTVNLHSTNGTCVANTPIAGPRALVDGDVLQIGSVELTFRAWSADAARETERIHRKPN